MKKINILRGFTTIEILVVLGIIGVFMVINYPSILNTLETRSIENQAKEILTTLQTARFKAIDTKINHRVRFFNRDGKWQIMIERETSPDNWSLLPGYVIRTISPRFIIELELPEPPVVEFSSVGTIEDFDSTRNLIVLKSQKLKGYRQPNARIVQIFGGGSIKYSKETRG